MTGPEGPPEVLEEAATGQPLVAPPLLSSAGALLWPEDICVRFSPGAGEGMRRRRPALSLPTLVTDAARLISK
jgi:hypothetical protein